MKEVPGYTKILAIGSAYTENSLVGDVVIQEKVDGSMFAFGVNEDGEIVMRSKGAIQSEEKFDQMFKQAIDFVLSIKDILAGTRDIYFYCEYLQKPKHNTLKYDRIPQNHLVLFDIMTAGRWLSRTELEANAKLIGIDVIPELYRGPADVEKIKSLLTTKSYLGEEIIEGVVIKNYNQTILLGGQVFPLFTKYVREEFKERHSADWKVRQPKGALQEFVDGFKSEARWQKAVIHAKEKSLLTKSPKDIGVLLPMIQKDIVEEEKENIKNHLYKCFIDDILRKSIAGFPEWYKNQLLESIK